MKRAQKTHLELFDRHAFVVFHHLEKFIEIWHFLLNQVGQHRLGWQEWKRNRESGDVSEREGARERIWIKGSDGVWKREEGGGEGKNINRGWLNEPENYGRRGRKTPTSSLGNVLLLKNVFCSLCRQSRTLIDSLSSEPLAGKKRTEVSF